MKNYDILLIEKDVCFIMNYTTINAYSEGLPSESTSVHLIQIDFS